MKRYFSAIRCVFVFLAHSPAWADGMDSLEAFVRGVRSGTAEFVQVVTASTKPGVPPRSKTSSGTFEFQRPDRFRFDYVKPFAQSIVADGQTLWMYDPDLNQVVARKQADALRTTPAAVFASARDLKALRTDFELRAEESKDGTDWVEAIPRAEGNAIARLRIGLREGELSELEIQDSLGQQSRLTFSNRRTNIPMAVGRFVFKPPAGADIVRP